jgi:hypothetical protein
MISCRVGLYPFCLCLGASYMNCYGFSSWYGIACNGFGSWNSREHVVHVFRVRFALTAMLLYPVTQFAAVSETFESLEGIQWLRK